MEYTGHAHVWNIPEFTADSESEMPEWVHAYIRHIGIPESEHGDFFNPDFDTLPSPYAFADMKKAVDRILSAIEKREKIAIHGDYDCDGVCSSTILYDALKRVGYNGDPIVYLPHRETEGYGLNSNTVQTLIDNGVQLIVTTDCGSSNVDEVEQAKRAGIDIIILDHHQKPEIVPDAYAILNSAWESEPFPDKRLCATGVVYFVASALLEKARTAESPKWYLDIVAVGTVGDMMPLIGVNRILVANGLRVLKKTKWPGLRALMSVAGIEPERVHSESVGFGIVPRLNAAGRMDHANTAFELLKARTEAEAIRLARDVHALNAQRKSQTRSYVEAAEKQLESQRGRYGRLVEGDNWPHGLLGLIAGRICESERAPTIVVSHSERGSVASGRGTEQVNMMKLLSHTKPYLLKFGGHTQACGFTLKNDINKNEWKKSVDEWFAGNPAPEGKQIRSAHIPLTLSDAKNAHAWSAKLGPFGQRVPAPVCITEPVSVYAVKMMGKKQNHMSCELTNNAGDRMRAILFNDGVAFADQHTDSKKYRFALTLSLNAWNGRHSIEGSILDWIYA